MTKSLTRFVSTVTLISALGLGAAYAQSGVPATGNAPATPAVTAPAKADVKAETKGKSVEHKAQKDHDGKTHALKADGVKNDAAKSDKKAEVTGSQTTVKAGTSTPAVAPKS